MHHAHLLVRTPMPTGRKRLHAALRAAYLLSPAAAMLWGCGSSTPPAASGAVAVPSRTASTAAPPSGPLNTGISDQALALDLKQYAEQQAAIKAVNDRGNRRVASGSLAKAQCWLDVSFHEYSRNDRSAFPALAMHESRLITQYLASGGEPGQGQDPSLATPLVNNAERLRPDLWAQAQRLRDHQGYVCAARNVSCAEVELAHAGNEFSQQGWRHAKPYVQMAEDFLGQAQRQAEHCPPPPRPPAPAAPPKAAAPVAAPVAAAPLPVPAPATVVREVINLSAAALFRFDKRADGDLLPEGRAQLEALAQRLSSAFSKVEQITLTGHTDRLGSPAYNQQLAQDRAQTVKAFLQSRGVQAPITTQGEGGARPLVHCAGDTPTPQLTSCLQPNRRVTVEVVGVRR